MTDDDPLPVDANALTPSMFVGDVIAGHGMTPLIKAAKAAGCQTAGGGQMVEAVQQLMVAFMLDPGQVRTNPSSSRPTSKT